MIVLPAAIGALIWSGVTLLIDAYMRRQRRPDLAERLVPYQAPMADKLGDEAQEWLSRQR
jgi:hypothetical protein